MIVIVQSLGSLWQTKDLPNGGTRVWNTTGIHDGSRSRSYATLFGQLVFGSKAKPFLEEAQRIQGRSWIAGEIAQSATGRTLRIACPAPSDAEVNWHLAMVRQELVGIVPADGVDPMNIVILSASQRKAKQELLLLVKPFAWITGPAGSAIIGVNERGIGRGSVRRW